MTELEIYKQLKLIEPYASSYNWCELYRGLVLCIERKMESEEVIIKGKSYRQIKQERRICKDKPFNESNALKFITIRLILSGIQYIVGFKIAGFISIHLKRMKLVAEMSDGEFKDYLEQTINQYNSKVIRGFVKPLHYHPFCKTCKWRDYIKTDKQCCIVPYNPNFLIKETDETDNFKDKFNLPILSARKYQSSVDCPLSDVLLNVGYLEVYIEHIKPQRLILQRVFSRIDEFVKTLSTDLIRVAEMVADNPIENIPKLSASHKEMRKDLMQSARLLFIQEYMAFDKQFAIHLSKYIHKYGDIQ